MSNINQCPTCVYLCSNQVVSTAKCRGGKRGGGTDRDRFERTQKIEETHESQFSEDLQT